MPNQCASPWLLFAALIALAAPGLAQMPMPMFPPMGPMPMPMPMMPPAVYAVPGAVAVCPPAAATTTTTPKPTPTPCPPLPIPYPIPLPIPMPPPMPPPYMCPPPYPPMGMPMMPGPPPVYLIPLPPQVMPVRRTTPRPDSESDSCEGTRRRGTRRLDRRRMRALGPRSRKPRPILSYVDRFGDVAYERGLSDRQALRIIQGMDSEQDASDSGRAVEVFQREPATLTVVASDRRPLRPSRRAAPVDRSVRVKQLEEGHKELVFHAPKDQKITNMTVSFRVVG